MQHSRQTDGVASNQYPDNKNHIRSFVRRQGRLTPGQQRALNELWPQFGIDLQPSVKLNLADLFGRNVTTIIDIGFGNGEALIEMAQQHPDWNFLGIEVHRPGIGHALLSLENQQQTNSSVDNVRLLCADAMDVLQQYIPCNSVTGITIFFPDPWPKKRHHKRRLIRPTTLALIQQVLQPQGFLYIATDWQDYATHIAVVIDTFPSLHKVAADALLERPNTKFEQRGRRLGHQVWELAYQMTE